MGDARKILIFVGTRPEAVKMAPVIHELRRRPKAFDLRVILTGQHESMVDQTLSVFGIRGDVRLSVMERNQTLSSLTTRLLPAIDALMESENPDWVLAQGDTTTVMVSALACFYRKVKFGHVEAGLRTGVMDNPFPEEANRRIADLFSAYLFAPTATNAAALQQEGYPSDRILVTGNTVVDALQFAGTLPPAAVDQTIRELSPERRIVAITLHRRESWGAVLEGMCRAILELSRETLKDGIQYVFPVHLNPRVREPVHQILSQQPNVLLTEPLDYGSFVALLRKSTLALTDSGGIQEEAPSFGVPVLVLRETTERPEAVQAGTAKLVGTDATVIVRTALDLLRDEGVRQEMVKRGNPFGDGWASRRIADALEGHAPAPFVFRNHADFRGEDA